jgi:hypothetical protein
MSKYRDAYPKDQQRVLVLRNRTVVGQKDEQRPNIQKDDSKQPSPSMIQTRP